MSKRHVVARGFAFTSDGVIYGEGDVISVDVFGGNEELFKKAVADKKIVVLEKEDITAFDDEGGEDEKQQDEKQQDEKNIVQKNLLEKFNKKELEDLAVKLNLEFEGKKKEEILSLVKKALAEFLKDVEAAPEEQVKNFAVVFGVEVDGKTKEELVAILTDFQK